MEKLSLGADMIGDSGDRLDGGVVDDMAESGEVAEVRAER